MTQLLPCQDAQHLKVGGVSVLNNVDEAATIIVSTGRYARVAPMVTQQRTRVTGVAGSAYTKIRCQANAAITSAHSPRW